MGKSVVFYTFITVFLCDLKKKPKQFPYPYLSNFGAKLGLEIVIRPNTAKPESLITFILFDRF